MISVDKETCGEDPSVTLGMTHHILKTDKIWAEESRRGQAADTLVPNISL